MPRFRKKPIEIEAWQWNGSRGQRGVCACEANSVPHLHTMHRNSLGGFQHVFLSEGDWIVPEPDGEHYYPVKPGVFAATYDPVLRQKPMRLYICFFSAPVCALILTMAIVAWIRWSIGQ